jgi:Spy/CpxP family protein refolding chaperone
MKKSNAVLSALSAALLVATGLAAPLAQAQPVPATAASAAARGAARLDKALQSVGVAAATRTSIEAILAQARADVKQLHVAAGNPRLQLQKVLAAATVDAAAAEAARQKVLALQDSVSLRMLQADLQVAALLTPAQRQQLETLKLQAMSKWQGGRG